MKERKAKQEEITEFFLAERFLPPFLGNEMSLAFRNSTNSCTTCRVKDNRELRVSIESCIMQNNDPIMAFPLRNSQSL
jgi:hypothetical protein